MCKDEMNEQPDFFAKTNQMTRALRPNPEGRFADLVRRRNSDGNEMMWLFGNFGTWRDAEGNDVVDHARRGVLSGSHKDLNDLRNAMIVLGVTIRGADTMYVPCSSAQAGDGRRFNDERPGQRIRDFKVEDLSLVRVDSITVEKLRQHLAWLAEGQAHYAQLSDLVGTGTAEANGRE